MSSELGTLLPQRPVAWFWFGLTAIPAGYLAAKGLWGWSALFAAAAALVCLEPRLRKRQHETVQVDDSGVLRVEGDVREQIAWDAIEEVRIVTTDGGPYQEDVFFVLADARGNGCLITHEAAERTKLLEELQKRFPGVDDSMVIKAMGSTSNNSFVIWRKTHAG